MHVTGAGSLSLSYVLDTGINKDVFMHSHVLSTLLTSAKDGYPVDHLPGSTSQRYCTLQVCRNRSGHNYTVDHVHA